MKERPILFSAPMVRAILEGRNAFWRLWNRLNEVRGYGLDKNPWVWVVEFRRV